MEAFPAQFCRAVRSYWRRRRYERLEGGKRKTVAVAQLGAGTRKPFRLRRRTAFGIKIRILLAPVRLLTRLRDGYVDAMLGVAGQGSGLSASAGSESLLRRRIPKARPAKLEPGQFDRRMLLEICRSIRASGEFAVY